MIIRQIYVTSKFERQFKKLPKRIKEIAKAKETIFRQNPFDPRLLAHKLHAKEKEIWFFSVTRSYRIKFIF